METITKRILTPGANIPLLLKYEENCFPRPAVIVLHGTRRNKVIGAEEHDAYLKGGDFIRVYPDAPLHGERAILDHKTALDSTWEGYLQGKGDALHEVMIPMVYGLAQEVGIIIDCLLDHPQLITPHFGVYGFSVAGLASFMAAGLEPRLDAAVMLSAPLRFLFMMIGRAYEWDEASLIEAEAYDPMAHPERFFPTALLFSHGVRDDLAPVEVTRDVVRRLEPYYQSNPERLRLSEYPHVRHYLDKPAPYVGPEGQRELLALRTEAKDWLKNFLNPREEIG
jgi:hypothetical protein